MVNASPACGEDSGHMLPEAEWRGKVSDRQVSQPAIHLCGNDESCLLQRSEDVVHDEWVTIKT